MTCFTIHNILPFFENKQLWFIFFIIDQNTNSQQGNNIAVVYILSQLKV